MHHFQIASLNKCFIENLKMHHFQNPDKSGQIYKQSWYNPDQVKTILSKNWAIVKIKHHFHFASHTIMTGSFQTMFHVILHL